MDSYSYASQPNLVDRMGEVLCSTVLHLICIKGSDNNCYSLMVSLGAQGEFRVAKLKVFMRAVSFLSPFHIYSNLIFNAQAILGQKYGAYNVTQSTRHNNRTINNLMFIIEMNIRVRKFCIILSRNSISQKIIL